MLAVRDNRGAGSKWRDPDTGKWTYGPTGEFAQGTTTKALTKEEAKETRELAEIPREEVAPEELVEWEVEVELRDEYFD